MMIYYGKSGIVSVIALLSKRGVGVCLLVYSWSNIDVAGITGIAPTIGGTVTVILSFTNGSERNFDWVKMPVPR